MNQFIFIIILTALGYIVGSWVEKRHYRSIEKREKAYLGLPAVSSKRVFVDSASVVKSEMVYGNAVISIDYFKRILAGFRNIFGGTVISYESLIDRARREAVLRMKEMSSGATVIVNVRIETSNVGNQSKQKSVGCLEAFAYGTALTIKQ